MIYLFHIQHIYSKQNLNPLLSLLSYLENMKTLLKTGNGSVGVTVSSLVQLKDEMKSSLLQSSGSVGLIVDNFVRIIIIVVITDLGGMIRPGAGNLFPPSSLTRCDQSR